MNSNKCSNNILEISNQYCDDAEYNGFLFMSYYIPEEIVVQILSYVDPESLVFQCRRVCKNWKILIDNNSVWKYIIRRRNTSSLSKIPFQKRYQLNLPSYLYFSIVKNDPFERNLLKNNCGQENLKFWKVVSPEGISVDESYTVENPPIGSDPLPNDNDFDGNTCCFATSYLKFEKEQLINLKELNISRILMDQCQPVITVSEWFTGRFDCGCKYWLSVYLLNESHEIIHERHEKRSVNQWAGRNWKKVTISIQNYGFGIRYILLKHGGKDSQFWAGYYGSKFAGSVVKLSLPEL